MHNTALIMSDSFQSSNSIHYRLKGHSHKVSGIDFSHDSQLLASCSWDKSIIIWGVQARQEFHRVDLSAWPLALAWAPSRLQLACATMDRKIIIYDVSQQFHPEFRQLSGAALAAVATLRAHDEGVWSLAWCKTLALSQNAPALHSFSCRSPDGKWLASGAP